MKKVFLFMMVFSMLTVASCQKAKKDEPAPQTSAEETNRGEDISAFLQGKNKALVDELK